MTTICSVKYNGQTAIAGETVLAEFGSAKGPVVSRRG